MKTIIAIDPGKNGGIAWESENNRACCVSMPDTEGDLIKLIKQFGIELYEINSEDGNLIASTKIPVDCIFYLENIVMFAGRKMPGSHAITYGGNWGFIKGAIQMSGSPLHIVQCKAWQKFHSLGTKGESSDSEWKNKLKAKAQQLYPHLDITLKTADALLILAYAKALEMGKVIQ